MRYPRIAQATHQIRSRWKFLLSFTKKDWQLTDYPIVCRRQNAESFRGPERLRPVPWVATITNWSMTGSGDTKRAALDSLNRLFETAKATGEPAPRPGTYVPIKFALVEKVSQFPLLRDDFIHRVLEIQWAFLSDESSLWDFHELESNNELNGKILATYGVEVSDIADGNIAAILHRIATSGHVLAR